MEPNSLKLFATIFFTVAAILILTSVIAFFNVRRSKALKIWGITLCTAAIGTMFAGAYLEVSIIFDKRVPILIWQDEDVASKMVVVTLVVTALCMLPFFLGIKMQEKAMKRRRR